MNLLDQPARKYFISSLTPQGPAVKSILWLQGVVVQKSEGEDEICIDDGTGVALIMGCDKIPAACPKVKLGQYVMVICMLMKTAPRPVLRGIKVQDLSGCVLAETMWMLEVVDSPVR